MPVDRLLVATAQLTARMSVGIRHAVAPGRIAGWHWSLTLLAPRMSNFGHAGPQHANGTNPGIVTVVAATLDSRPSGMPLAVDSRIPN